MLTILFAAVKISFMQSNKAKKTLKIAEETIAAAPENSTATEATANPRNSRSSKPKKNEINEPMSAKHHRKATISVASETPNVDGSPATRTMAASVDSHSTKVAPAEVTQEQIAKLAHSYWVARGYAHGSAEQDWLSAERELTRR